MKQLFALLTLTAVLNFGTINVTYAQDANATEQTAEDSATQAKAEADAKAKAEADAKAKAEKEAQAADAATEDVVEEDLSFTQIIKQKFIEGGPGFMGIVLVCLILGLAIVIERIVYLNMATTNTDKLLKNIEDSLNAGGVEAAKEVCRNTKGPVASIFYQGLDRSHEGIDMVEKSVVSYGGVQMGLLEKGISWISLFIALAPMLGFMGTVIGMIGAFDAIAAAGDISPAVVADGIKVALLTTVFGLIVAIILQIFYNYIVAKVDNLVNDMENASISLIDLLVKHQLSKK
ncbi:MAG: MotA/TolQ/ExbB proton channel family protein [Vicingaceae bacterium]|nr:MotA/TolQ/ExbB proton channel family protein [Vicingaceae bacterium]